jgi:hypothetical protein
MRVEEWQQVRAAHPSFETAAQEGGLLQDEAAGRSIYFWASRNAGIY